MFSATTNRVLTVDTLRRLVFAVLAFAAVATFAAAAAPHADAAAWCKSGYVWREAFPGDFACVTPIDRQTVTNQNAAAASRHLPNSTWCVSGYVWRETRPSDLVCVPPGDRAREVQNNLNAIYNVADARTTPSSGSTSTSYDSTGGYVYAWSSGLTPSAAIKVFALGPWSGPYSMGTVTANGAGQLSNAYVSHLSCWRNQHPATIVVLDTKTGNVTNLGANYAINHCG